MTIAAIGDIHLGAVDRYIPNAYVKVLDTVNRIVTNCTSKGIRHVVLLGDVADGVKLPDHMFLALCDLLRRHDVKWYALVGNHDRASSDDHSLRVLDWMGKAGMINIRVFNEPEIVKIAGHRYFMCPSPYVEDVPSKCRYGFGHFGFSGAKSDQGITLKSKNNPAGRWIMGDYHTPQQGKTYIYAGSVTQTKFSELPDKGYIELDDKPKFVSWKPSIVLSRKHLESLEDFKALDKNVYYVVTLSQDVKVPVDWVTRYPNVIRLVSERPVSKKAMALLKSIKTTDVLAGLDGWLAKKGLTDKQIRLAHKLLGE